MSWMELGADAWRVHPLNRIRGWLIPIVLLLIIQGPLQGVLLLAGAVADFEAFRSVFDGQVSDWFEWVQLVVPTLGAMVLLILIYMRARRFPEIIAAFRGLAYLIAIAGGAFSGWTVSWFRLVEATLIAGEIGLIIYLFVGARPNVIFKRRIRNAS
jgi:hypothetical protein